MIYQDDSNLSKLLVTSNSIFIGGANKVVKLLKQGEKWEKVQTRNIEIDKNHPPIHPCCISKGDQESAWILKFRKTLEDQNQSVSGFRGLENDGFSVNLKIFSVIFFSKKDTKKKTKYFWPISNFWILVKGPQMKAWWMITDSKTGFEFESGQKLLEISMFWNSNFFFEFSLEK